MVFVQITLFVFFAFFALIAFLIIGRLFGFFRKDKDNPVETFLYEKRHTVMNDSESAFFYEITKQISDGYFVFPKMRIADFIKINNGRGYYKQRNKILPKHIDFLICDKYLQPIFAIELDGKSHNNPSRIARDQEIEDIFEGVHLPLERVGVGENFSNVISSLLSDYIAK